MTMMTKITTAMAAITTPTTTGVASTLVVEPGRLTKVAASVKFAAIAAITDTPFSALTETTYWTPALRPDIPNIMEKGREKSKIAYAQC